MIEYANYVPDRQLYPDEPKPRYSGKICPICGERIEIGEDIVSIKDGFDTVAFHQGCFENDIPYDFLKNIGISLAYERGE